MFLCNCFGAEDDWRTEVRRQEEPIYLNVYNLPNAQVNQLQYAATQTGLYHAGVEVFGKEWSFGARPEGIYTVRPRRWNELRPCHTLAMGKTSMTRKEFSELIKRMKFDWLGSEYHLLSRNCCSFSRSLLQEIGGKDMPGWVDRGAREGTTKVTSALVQGACHLPHALVRGTGVGLAAFGGEIVAGQAGGLVGEAVGGDTGKTVGHETGKLVGAVGVGAAVGAFGGPAGAAAGAGIGAASYVVGKVCDGVATLIDPNTVVLPDRQNNDQFNEDAASHGFFFIERGLKNKREGARCTLAVEGNKGELGSRCICYTKKAERGQKWKFTKDGYVQSMHGQNLFLAVSQNSYSRGMEVVLQRKKPSERGQRWTLEGDGHLRNGNGTYLAVAENGGKGCTIVTWSKLDEAGQRWRLSRE